MLLRSPIRRLQDLVAAPPLDVGDVSAINDGIATIDLIGGGQTHAHGAASVGQRVLVRGDAIEGVVPSLPVELIEI